MTSSQTRQAFVDKWRHVELKERAAGQEHFINLCRLIDYQGHRRRQSNPLSAKSDR